MPEPVIVLHEVNTRSRKGFEEKVARLNTLVPDTWQFIPVFWGDITLRYDDELVLGTAPSLRTPTSSLPATRAARGRRASWRAHRHRWPFP